MKRCELLIPAGGKEQFIAAVESGADAVYAGGRLFSARANAGNFSDEDMKRAIDYAHVRGVKTYVTMNTLLTDRELEEAFKAAREYYLMGADGLIIQDLGLGAMVRENLPGIGMHFSTQASVYDAAGVRAAAGLGYDRVVVAREMTFSEIKEAVATGTEIEVFVHGALCICYSGQCQLSRYIGGRSGNKGTCAQPCRLPYKGIKDQPYPLSPRDMCLAEEVGALAKSGVASLKVEGRMKSPEYVAVVTSVYRRLLDEFYEKGKCSLTAGEAEELTQIFNRSGFTKGYFYGDPGRQLMSFDFPKNTGVRIGTVLKDSKGPLALISADRPVKKGDYVEIHGRPLTGNLVTYVKDAGPAEATAAGCRVAATAVSDEGRCAQSPTPAAELYILQIGDIKKPVKKGAPVYRLTSDALMKKAAADFKDMDFEEGQYLRKVPVVMKARVEASSPAVLEVKLAEPRGGDDFMTKVSGAVATPSDNGHSCVETFRRQLNKTGGTPYEAAAIEVEEKEACYLSTADMNSLRRKALRKLSEKLAEAARKDRRLSNAPPACGSACDAALTQAHGLSSSAAPEPPRPCGSAESSASAPSSDLLELYFYDSGVLTDETAEKIIAECRKAFGGVTLRPILPIRRYEKWEKCFPKDVRPFAYLPQIGKGKADRWIEDNAARISSVLKEKNAGIYIGSLNHIETFARRGVSVIGDSPLNALNKKSAETISSLGASEVRYSLEVADKTMGPYPLMVTEHRFDTGELTDRKGQRYRLLWDDFAEKTTLMAAPADEGPGIFPGDVTEKDGVKRLYICLPIFKA